MKRFTTAGLLIAVGCAAELVPQEPPRNENRPEETGTIRIVVTSIFVEDQSQALKFYTEVLGFVKKTEIPDIRWLTVVSPAEPDGVELLLEPVSDPATRTFQRTLRERGTPLASFAVADVEREYERLRRLGVVFRRPPTKTGPVTVAVFEDTCGNLIQIAAR